jgi:acyl-CoA synthetase (AMP-forming)/AMP-acid ligase II
MTMADALRQTVESHPGQEAFVCGDVRHSYAQLLDRVESLAHGLHGLGLDEGDRVTALLHPGPEFVYLFFAVARLGAVIVPLNPQLRSRRLRAVLRDADPVLLVTGRIIGEDTLSRAPGLRHVVVAGQVEDSGGHRSLKDLMAWEGGGEGADLGKIDVTPHDLLALLYTSGTTGTPKGVMHSHRSLIAPVAATLKVRKLWQRPSLRMLGKQIKALARHQERLLRVAGGPQTFLSTTGWYTITGLEVMLQGLLMGDRLVVMPRFHPRRALELVERERVTVLVAVPTAYQVMLRMEGFDEHDTSSLIVCGTGAAPCPPHLAREIEARFGCAVHIGFGATETGGGVAVSDLADSNEQRTETVGRPLSQTEVKIVDEHGRERPPGEVGELLCRSEGIMLGYYGDPDMTAEVMDEDGWYHTGDLAMMDEDGYLRIVGRKKNMIIRGGQNIYPAEIENYLTAHPKIREAAVVGVPATVGGESVWAFIILEEGAEMDPHEVKGYCRDALEPHKIPSQVRFAADFPRASTGKPQKFRLRARALREKNGREPA